MKKSKKIVSMIIAVLFVGSLGYFATLTPTGAWLYDADLSEQSVDFGNFDVSSGSFSVEESITFDATTKIADSDCVDDFDSAYEFSADETMGKRIVYQKDISIVNNGNLDADVYLKIDSGVESGDAKSEAGIRYFFYLLDDNSSETKNSEVIADKLGNSITKAVLNAYNNGKITIEKNTEKTLRILIWSDYDDVGGALSGTTQKFQTTARIALTAIQQKSENVTDSEGTTYNEPISDYYSEIYTTSKS